MGDKQRRTVSIDEDIDEHLDRENVNASGVVNSLLREYVAAGRAPEAALEMRLNEIEEEIKQKRMEKARVESEIDRLERKKREVEKKIEERNKEEIEAVQKMVGMLESGQMPESSLTSDNPAVVNHAEDAGMTPTRFMEKVEAEYNNDA